MKKLIKNLKNQIDNSFVGSTLGLFHGIISYSLNCRSSWQQFRFVYNARKNKYSDTVFILGCGASLNEYTKEQWKQINQGEVVALSYACFLEHCRQDFYFIECPNKFPPMISQAVFNQIRRQYASGLIKNVIWKSRYKKEYFSSDTFPFSEYITFPEGKIQSENLDDIDRILDVIFAFNLNEYFLIHKRASLFDLVLFCLALDYKKIVFCGVDLNGSDYFFYDHKRYPHLKHIAELHSSTRSTMYNVESDKGAHATNNPDFGIPVDVLLKIILGKRKNTHFFTMSQSSSLADYMDLYIN